MKKSLIVLVGVLLMAFAIPSTVKASSSSVNSLPQAVSEADTPAPTAFVAANIEEPVAQTLDEQAAVDEIMIAANVDDDALIFLAPNTGESNMIYLVYGMASLAIAGLVVASRKVLK